MLDVSLCVYIYIYIHTHTLTHSHMHTNTHTHTYTHQVLVGLSGGKDSLTMLHVLLELQRRSPIRFDIGAATVDPQTPEYGPSCVRMCVCVCVCVRACIHAHICTYNLYIYTLVDIGAATVDPQTPAFDIHPCHLCMYVCVYMHISVRTCRHVCVCKYV